LYVLSEDAAANLRRYVENGGILLTTARSGVKDEANAVVDMPLPGLLAEVCGVEVDEYDTLPGDVNVPLAWELPDLVPGAPAAHARLWCDVLAPTTARAVARYSDHSGDCGQYYAGRAAVTLNRFGQGQAVYVGTVGDATLHDALVGWLMEAAGVAPTLSTPDGVEAVERWKDGHRLLFLLNHADQSREVSLPRPLKDSLTGQVLQGQAILGPKAVMILREA
jgi:beta-galactosidase